MTCRLPPSKNAYPQIRIEDADPITEPEAPGGEIESYKIEFYDGQRWRNFHYVTRPQLIAFYEDVAELLDDPGEDSHD